MVFVACRGVVAHRAVLRGADIVRSSCPAAILAAEPANDQAGCGLGCGKAPTCSCLGRAAARPLANRTSRLYRHRRAGVGTLLRCRWNRAEGRADERGAKLHHSGLCQAPDAVDRTSRQAGYYHWRPRSAAARYQDGDDEGCAGRCCIAACTRPAANRVPAEDRSRSRQHCSSGCGQDAPSRQETDACPCKKGEARRFCGSCRGSDRRSFAHIFCYARFIRLVDAGSDAAVRSGELSRRWISLFSPLLHWQFIGYSDNPS